VERARVHGSLGRVRELDLNDLRMFVRVVDRGRFAAAARELGVPTSTVSRAVVRLEAKTGTRLLQRTPRSLRATPEGRALYNSVSEAVVTLERAGHAVEPATGEPAGRLRVTAPAEIGSAFLAEVAVAFTDHYPAVQVELVLTNRAVSLVDEGFDLAVRAAPKLSDSSLVARKVGDLEHALYASPGYLANRGSPKAPADLPDHQCLAFRAKDFEKTWRLQGEKQIVEVKVRAHLVADDFGYLRATALAGGGIALLPRLLCAKDEASGRLVRLFPRFSAKGATLFVMYPSAAHVPARVTAFRDFVVAAFAASPASGAARRLASR
jgi:DNA-binding transcriptional LysR family regulator